MTVNEYHASIKQLIDGTTNLNLLKLWKSQLEWDIEHEEEINLISIRTDKSGHPEYEAPFCYNNVFSIKSLVIIKN